MLSPVIVLIPGHVVAETVLKVHGGLFDVSLKRQRWSALIFISRTSAICGRDRITFHLFCYGNRNNNLQYIYILVTPSLQNVLQ